MISRKMSEFTGNHRDRYRARTRPWKASLEGIENAVGPIVEIFSILSTTNLIYQVRIGILFLVLLVSIGHELTAFVSPVEEILQARSQLQTKVGGRGGLVAVEAFPALQVLKPPHPYFRTDLWDVFLFLEERAHGRFGGRLCNSCMNSSSCRPGR